MALLAEELLLLLLDDATGKPLVGSPGLDYALAGALLVELAAEQRVQVDGRGRLVVTNPQPVGDPVLDAALERVTREDRKPDAWVPRLSKDVRPHLLARLAQTGDVREEHDRVLGLFPRSRWPQATSGREEQVRTELLRVLGGEAPTPRAIGLLSLLAAVDALPKALPGVDKRAAKARTKQLAEGAWASVAVHRAVQAVAAATAAGVTAAVTASTIATS